MDDRLSARSALGRIRRHEYLLYTGDFHNAKQLLVAMGRRLPAPRPSASLQEVFRAERSARELEHQTLGRLVVALDRDYRLSLARAPDAAEACRWAWGEADSETTVVPFKTLLGILSAAEWRRKGLDVPGLQGRLTPHYGVYLPTRTDYTDLLVDLPQLAGKRVFDLGTGTGVLSFLLLQAGAHSVLATDCDVRALACAKENAQRLGFAERFEALEADIFPPGKADLVVTNPPWIPEPPKNRVDRAVFDADHRFLRGFLEGLPAHLAPGGEALLLLSDLPVLLGLRPATWLDEQLARCGLKIQWTRTARARHAKSKDAADPLHAARSREVTTLYCLAPDASARSNEDPHPH